MRKPKKSDLKQWDRRHRPRGAGLYHPPEAAARWLADVREAYRGDRPIIAFGPPLVPSLSGLSTADLDAFGKTAGLHGIGDSWEAITRTAAADQLAEWTSHSLCHNIRLVPDATAAALAKRFVGLFADDALFFTNVDQRPAKNSRGWMPLTDATMDAGVIACDVHLMGLVVAACDA